MDERGKINVDSRHHRGSGRARQGGEYVLAWADESGTNRDIVITDVDIDNLMRAKAAIYAGIKILLRGGRHGDRHRSRRY